MLTKDIHQRGYFQICFIGNKVTFQLLYVYTHTYTPREIISFGTLVHKGFILKTYNILYIHTHNNSDFSNRFFFYRESLLYILHVKCPFQS